MFDSRLSVRLNTFSMPFLTLPPGETIPLLLTPGSAAIGNLGRDDEVEILLTLPPMGRSGSRLCFQREDEVNAFICHCGSSNVDDLPTELENSDSKDVRGRDVGAA